MTATATRATLPGSFVRTERLRHLGPNWYACVMGTAIIANGAAALPVSVPGLRSFAVVMWALSFAMLIVLSAARAVHLLRHRDEARFQLLENPATAVFYGCPPMAFLAVGYGTLVLGQDVFGAEAAVRIDAVLWTAGTIYSLAVAFGIPYLMMTRHNVDDGTANPTWLLPVVAPMVAAALGPALIPHLPAGEPRSLMLYGCYALFGGSLLATLAILPGVWTRLMHDPLPLAMVPTLFLVLGPLGQSTTAVNQIAATAPSVAPAYAGAMAAFAVLYGVPVLGFALLWLALSVTATVRALRSGMPFAMTWWAYTFPLGTCVTGASALAKRLDLNAMTVIAAGLYLVLVAAWAIAATRTLRGIVSGRLFQPPAPAPAPAQG